MGKLSAAWASSWVDGIDRFPQGGSVGFLMDTERRTLRGIAAHSRVKTGNRPSGVGKPLQQPASVTPSHHSLHNQADSAADHTLTPLHSRSLQLPVTLLSTEPQMNKKTFPAQFKSLIFSLIAVRPFSILPGKRVVVVQPNVLIVRKQTNLMKFRI